jgi:hypothetical protein
MYWLRPHGCQFRALMAVRENERVARKAPRNGPRRVVTPIATISWEGLMV